MLSFISKLKVRSMVCIVCKYQYNTILHWKATCRTRHDSVGIHLNLTFYEMIQYVTQVTVINLTLFLFDHYSNIEDRFDKNYMNETIIGNQFITKMSYPFSTADFFLLTHSVKKYNFRIIQF